MTHYYVKAASGPGEEILPAGRTGGRQNAIEKANAPAGSEITGMSMLELRGVSKSYGQGSAEVHALREVNR